MFCLWNSWRNSCMRSCKSSSALVPRTIQIESFICYLLQRNNKAVQSRQYDEPISMHKLSQTFLPKAFINV